MAPNVYRTENRPDPAESAAALTPNNGVDLSPNSPRGLYVGGGGDVTVVMFNNPDGETVLFAAVPAGSILPIRVKRLMATGTTATSIVALY